MNLCFFTLSSPPRESIVKDVEPRPWKPTYSWLWVIRPMQQYFIKIITGKQETSLETYRWWKMNLMEWRHKAIIHIYLYHTKLLIRISRESSFPEVKYLILSHRLMSSCWKVPAVFKIDPRTNFSGFSRKYLLFTYTHTQKQTLCQTVFAYLEWLATFWGQL